MKNQKKLAIISAIIFVLGTFIIETLQKEVFAQDKPILLKVGTAEHLDNPNGRSWQTFARYVEGASGGKFKVEIYPNNQLGAPEELFESVQSGSLKVAACDETTYGYYPPMMILNVPYLFSSEGALVRFLDSSTMKELKDGLIKKTGVRLLGISTYGFRNFANNKRPIKSPADMKGLKMRVMKTPMFVKMVSSLGAGATPLSWGELYSALQQGVIDGFDNPLGVIYDYKFYEVQKYVTVDEHVVGISTMIVNEKFFQSLPKELREVLIQGGRIGSLVETGMRAYGNRVTNVKKLMDKGMEVYVPNPEEKAMFKDATQKPILVWLEKEIGKEWVDKALRDINRINSELDSSLQPVK